MLIKIYILWSYLGNDIDLMFFKKVYIIVEYVV